MKTRRALAWIAALAPGLVFGCGALLDLQPTHGDSSDSTDGAEPPDRGADAGDGPVFRTCAPGDPVDITTNKDHCGGCFHSCKSGACTAGFCPVRPLFAAEAGENARLVVSLEHGAPVLHATDDGPSIRRVDANGQVTEIRTAERKASLITTAPFGLVWSRANADAGVEVCSLKVGVSPEECVGSASSAFRGLAVSPSGRMIVVTSETQLLSRGTTQLFGLDKGTSLWGIAAGGDTISGDELYWTDKGAATLHRMNVPPGFGVVSTTCLVASLQSEATELALTATHVYWLTADAIRRAPFATCDAKVEVVIDNLTGPRAPVALAVDLESGSVYWTDSSRVFRLGASPPDGTPLALTADTPNLRRTLGVRGDDVAFMTDKGVNVVAR